MTTINTVTQLPSPVGIWAVSTHAKPDDFDAQPGEVVLGVYQGHIADIAAAASRKSDDSLYHHQVLFFHPMTEAPVLHKGTQGTVGIKVQAPGFNKLSINDFNQWLKMKPTQLEHSDVNTNQLGVDSSYRLDFRA